MTYHHMPYDKKPDPEYKPFIPSLEFDPFYIAEQREKARQAGNQPQGNYRPDTSAAAGLDNYKPVPKKAPGSPTHSIVTDKDISLDVDRSD